MPSEKFDVADESRIYTGRVMISPGARAIAFRIIAAVFGGYGFVWGVVACLTSLLIAVGVLRSESVIVATLLGFPLYLFVLLWAFAVRSLIHVFVALAVGDTALFALSRLLRGLI